MTDRLIVIRGYYIETKIYSGCGRVVYGAGHNAKRLVLQCINSVSSIPVEGRTKICQLKDLILTLFGLIFRPSITSNFEIQWDRYGCHLLRCLYIYICTLFKIYFFLRKEHTCFSPVQWDPVNPDVQEHWPGAIHVPPFGHDVVPWQIAVMKKTIMNIIST